MAEDEPEQKRSCGECFKSAFLGAGQVIAETCVPHENQEEDETRSSSEAQDADLVDCRRLLWRLRFERRLQRAIRSFMVIVIVLACLSGGLSILQPTKELAATQQALRARFMLDHVQAITDFEGVYSYADAFAKTSSDLKSASGRFWCEERYLTVVWDNSLMAPVKMCSSPRMNAVGVDHRPLWSSVYQAGFSPSGDCTDDENGLRSHSGRMLSCGAASLCENVETAQYCRRSCGYCGPFRYEELMPFPERQITITPAVFFQTRKKTKACEGFADSWNKNLRVRPNLVDGSYKTGTAAMLCGDPDTDFSKEDSSISAPGFSGTEVLGGVDENVSAKMQTYMGKSKELDEFLGKKVYAELLGDDTESDAMRLRDLVWLDSMTDVVTVANLVYTEVSQIFTYIAVEFRVDGAGGVRAEPIVRSYRELSDFTTVYARLLAALVLSLGLFLRFAYQFFLEKSEYILDRPRKGGEVADDSDRNDKERSIGLSVTDHKDVALKDGDKRKDSVVYWGQSFKGTEKSDGFFKVHSGPGEGHLPMSKEGVRVVFSLKAIDSKGTLQRGRMQELVVLLIVQAFMWFGMLAWAELPYIETQYTALLNAVLNAQPQALKHNVLTDPVTTAFFTSATELLLVARWAAGIRAAAYFVLLIMAYQAICYLGVHPRARMLVQLLQFAGIEVLHALGISVAVFLLLAGAAHFAFGAHAEAYASYSASLSTQLKWLFGQVLVDQDVLMQLSSVRSGIYHVYVLFALFFFNWGVSFVLVAIGVQALLSLQVFSTFAARTTSPDVRPSAGAQWSEKELQEFEREVEASCVRDFFTDVFDCAIRLPWYLAPSTHAKVASMLAGPAGLGALHRRSHQDGHAPPGMMYTKDLEKHLTIGDESTCLEPWRPSALVSIGIEWNVDNFIDLYDWKCGGALRPYRKQYHPLRPAFLGAEPNPPAQGPDAPPELNVEEDEDEGVSPWVSIPDLDEETEFALRDRVHNIVNRWLDWAEYHVHSWEELAPTMACSVVQETLLTILESPGEDQDLGGNAGGLKKMLERIKVQPFGVLGSLETKSAGIIQQVPEPDSGIAIVDPAGLEFIQKIGPRGAGGAAGAIYKWLGIAHFPGEVTGFVQRPMDAKLHKYRGDGVREAVVIHAVGPDFRDQDYNQASGHEKAPDYATALTDLTRVYRNIMLEFVKTDVQKLRMLPVSSGIFAGPFAKDLPSMTVEAIALAFDQLQDDQKENLLQKEEVDMCIFQETDYHTYKQAFIDYGLAPAGAMEEAQAPQPGLVIQDSYTPMRQAAVASPNIQREIHKMLQPYLEDNRSHASSESI